MYHYHFLSLTILLEYFYKYNKLVYRGSRVSFPGISYNTVVQYSDSASVLTYSQYCDRMRNGGIAALTEGNRSLVIELPIYMQLTYADADYSGDLELSKVEFQSDKLTFEPIKTVAIWADTSIDYQVNTMLLQQQTFKLHAISSRDFIQIPMRVEEILGYYQMFEGVKILKIVMEVGRLRNPLPKQNV